MVVYSWRKGLCVLLGCMMSASLGAMDPNGSQVVTGVVVTSKYSSVNQGCFSLLQELGLAAARYSTKSAYEDILYAPNSFCHDADLEKVLQNSVSLGVAQKLLLTTHEEGKYTLLEQRIFAGQCRCGGRCTYSQVERVLQVAQAVGVQRNLVRHVHPTSGNTVLNYAIGAGCLKTFMLLLRTLAQDDSLEILLAWSLNTNNYNHFARFMTVDWWSVQSQAECVRHVLEQLQSSLPKDKFELYKDYFLRYAQDSRNSVDGSISDLLRTF